MDVGFYRGRHFTTFVEDVKALRRTKRNGEAEQLLLRLVEATEAEDAAEDMGVAPWYYEQLAILYRERTDYRSEVEILGRYSKQKHAPGALPARLLERSAKAQLLLKRSKEPELTQQQTLKSDGRKRGWAWPR